MYNSLVSVVIPTHNRADLLPRALESAIKQTYNNIEIIVVSDGSNDGTDSIMEEYKNQYSFVKYISYFPGKGGNHARNEGIKAAVGEWVAFLDDDDEWHLDKIEKQLEVANSDSEIGIVCTAINSIDDKTGRTSIFLPKPLYDSSVLILKTNCIGSTTTVMVKRDAIIKAGLFDEDLVAKQDYEMWIRLCQITKVGVVDTPCVEYHNLVANNQISWNYQKYADATLYIDRKHGEIREQNLTQEELLKIKINGALSIARKAMKVGDRKIVRVYAKKAYKVKPNFKAFVYYFASFFPVEAIKRVRGIFGNKFNR